MQRRIFRSSRHTNRRSLLTKEKDKNIYAPGGERGTLSRGYRRKETSQGDCAGCLFRYCRKKEKEIGRRSSEIKKELERERRRRIQRGHSSHDIKRGCRPSETRSRPTLKTPGRSAAAAEATATDRTPDAEHQRVKKCGERSSKKMKKNQINRKQ